MHGAAEVYLRLAAQRLGEADCLRASAAGRRIPGAWRAQGSGLAGFSRAVDVVDEVLHGSLHLGIEAVLVEAAQHPECLPELDLAVLDLAGADQGLKHVCLPKITSGHIDGAVRPGSGGRRYCRPTQRREGPRHPCSMTNELAGVLPR
jgi:hypothetical protein